MKTITKCFSLLLPLILLFSKSWAAPVNPLPSVFGADDESTYFYPSLNQLVVGYEYFDYTNGEMGFFFSSDPATLIPIFEYSDQASGGSTPSAVVDFVNGSVWDFDALALQGGFTPNTSDPIGLYYQSAATGLLTTIPVINGGADRAAAFPLLAGVGYAVTFYVPNGSSGEVSVASYYLGPVVGTPPTPTVIPLPPAVWLFALALAFFIVHHRERRKRCLSQVVENG